jgi:transposase
MFPKFFELIACEHLIGAGAKPEYFNDDKLGRVLDKLFIKGLDTVFLAVSLNTVEIYQISLLSSHLDSTSFHVDGEYEYNLPEVIFKNQKELSAGRFIIATNFLSDKELSNEKMLSEYKAQQSCERGFSFLKNPLFLADIIFLKSPERIEALAMIMGLCLLVYTLAQREIRAALKSLNYTVKNQLGKAINNPTMRWIFQCF